ncbi:hypothetical protein L6452_06357 [Arctium lappa]|uniref:Uncharacterized protein n=1 Tax=Arctium lappa TaxID=4217 RepID=A0ACB9EJ63_ARCLA|nr:hypothetical protein L6452_06357 [Arctium lappa]
MNLTLNFGMKLVTGLRDEHSQIGYDFDSVTDMISRLEKVGYFVEEEVVAEINGGPWTDTKVFEVVAELRWDESDDDSGVENELSQLSEIIDPRGKDCTGESESPVPRKRAVSQNRLLMTEQVMRVKVEHGFSGEEKFPEKNPPFLRR